MAFDFLKELIPNLNPARLAALGETIFRETMLAKGASVKAVHDGPTDFLVDKKRGKVETSALTLDSEAGPLVPYQGKRVRGVSYALVEFFASGARVSREKETVALLDWDRLGELWQQWNQQRVEAAKGAGTRDERKLLLTPIKKELSDFFRGHGYSVRVLFRTAQAEFGNESPPNLKARSPKEKQFAIYLDFQDHEIRRDNLRAVYAFPESNQSELPMMEKVSVNQPRVDLSGMGRFKFGDADDLMKNWRRTLTSKKA